ncbi:MAG: hypothetical protein JHC20_03905 [Pyrobaculum sp.]|nr:hypothetical protein [Pyrobaculum sp.]
MIAGAGRLTPWPGTRGCGEVEPLVTVMPRALRRACKAGGVDDRTP